MTDPTLSSDPLLMISFFIYPEKKDFGLHTGIETVSE